jgi:DNA-binding GntR family transcriptional regulator
MSPREPHEDSARAAAPTLASNLYERIRTDLLAGRLEPGRRLQIEHLAEHYKAGQTPLREALNRLTADGLVDRKDQRGFAVAPVSADDLREITKTRCLIEEVALREAFALGGPRWEEDLVLAFHRLSRQPRSLNDHEYLENPEWERLHRAFHRTLIGGCGSRWLIGFCEQLGDQLYRYRQLAVRRTFPRRHHREEHAAMLQAVLDNDAERAIGLLKSHYTQTADIILGDEGSFAPGHEPGST